ncbi:hypothetical protein [Komagataeibacter oboediens]|uniref:hypothetical protein n=1 Tax=Komagataeibacter oboediens TaxID=65958 RepID=UPI0011B82CD6|nr:hypothetical protein [Komagataeibacter oboediens]
MQHPVNLSKVFGEAFFKKLRKASFFEKRRHPETFIIFLFDGLSAKPRTLSGAHTGSGQASGYGIRRKKPVSADMPYQRIILNHAALR